jgi:hypothetical protein
VVLDQPQWDCAAFFSDWWIIAAVKRHFWNEEEEKLQDYKTRRNAMDPRNKSSRTLMIFCISSLCRLCPMKAACWVR